MSVKGNNHWSKIFFTCILFAALGIIFLFSGTAVNKYYHILTPTPGRVIESIPGFSQKALDPGSIKVLNWNIYKGKRAGWKDDFIRLSGGMDIILIQEACIEDDNLDIFNIRGMGQHFAKSFSYHKESVFGTGVMTLSKVCPVRVDYLRTFSKEPVIHTSKISLITEYPFKKDLATLIVVNIHGLNFVRSAAFESQMSGLEKKIKDHRGPIIFSGDFNTWNKKRIFILSGITERLGLKEAVFFPDTRTKRFRYFLDHVFYKGLKIKQATVFKNIRSSDHKAMEIEFSLARS